MNRAGRALRMLAGGTLLACTACAGEVRPVPVPPGITFAAHEAHRGLVIDRTPDGATALAAPIRGRSWTEAATVLDGGEDAGAELHTTSPARVEVTGAPSGEGGRVEPTWRNDAIRLTIRPTRGPVIQSGVFHRLDHGAGPSELTRLAQDSIDVRGAYQAMLRDPNGRSVGWMGVIVGEDQPGHAAYQAVFPGNVDAALAAAATQALGSEIAWIEAHVHDVYRAPENAP